MTPKVIATYECLTLKAAQARGLKGKLAKDEDGYYKDVVLGAFGVHNTAGQYYDAEAGRRYFENDRQFIEKLEKGYLYSEMGHPKRAPGMTDREWLARVHTVEETNKCAHFRNIKLVTGVIQDKVTGRDVIAILGDVKPTGAHKQEMIDAFENNYENVAFSIRSITNDSVENNRWVKRIKRIITFDCVTSNGPGIEFANKHSSPSLESNDVFSFTESTVNDLMDGVSSGSVSMESDTDLESLRRDLFTVNKSEELRSMTW